MFRGHLSPVTATEARTIIQEVVEGHATHNTFYSIWSDAKDRPTEPVFPFVAWEQWRARLVETQIGLLQRLILVRLLIVTKASDTDRTAEERDLAVEQADNAAADIVLRLREQPYGWDISNISTSTVYDDRYQLDTGVILTFTVTTDGLCLGDVFTPPGECETFGELIAPLTWPQIKAEMSEGQIEDATDDLNTGGGSCTIDVVINVDGEEVETLTGLDPCEAQTYNINITYS